jgi:hypothetical protein
LTTAGPVARAVALLEEADYQIVERPLIAGIPFDFPAMLAGRGSLDLVAVIDLALDSDHQRVRRRVEGVARALDLVGSRRSLTVVLVGPRPDPNVIQAMSGVARVLTVAPGTTDAATLRDALAVLLPLELITEKEDAISSHWEKTRMELLTEHPEELELILAAADQGREAVTEALRAVLSQPLEELEAEDEESGA